MSQVFLNFTWKIASQSLNKTISGRNAWALHELVQAGEKGCAPIDNPAPAWAAYVQNLRGFDLDIETVTETHGGPFKGSHGRYVLRSDVTITEWSGYENVA